MPICNNHHRSNFDLGSLYLFFLLGTCETLHTNCAQAIIPDIVKPEELLTANARFTSVQVLSAQFVGPSLGVVLFNASSSLPFVADAFAFAGSAALVKSIPDVHAVEPATTRLRDDMLDGIRFLRDNAVLRRLTFILAALNFFILHQVRCLFFTRLIFCTAAT